MPEDIDEMEEVIQDFITEAEELIEELDENLVELENNPKDAELLNKIFRAFHTIKGSSGFLGFDNLTSLTHKLEDVLNKLRKFELEMNSTIMDVVLAGVDKTKLIIESIKNGEDYESINIDENITELNKILEPGDVARNKKEKIEKNTDKNEEAEESGDTDNLIALQEEEIKKEIKQNPEQATVGQPEKDIDAKIEELLRQRMEEDRKRRQERKIQKNISKSTDNSMSPAENKKHNIVEQTIRVDVNKLDDLMNLVGELVLSKNRLLRISQKVKEKLNGDEVSEELSGVASQITLVTSDLQMSAMKTRMITIGKVFNKFPRIVRDLSKKVDKDIDLIIEGADAELDKSVIEEINDPLVHLVRNAVDHGIENKAEREQSGKPLRGRVILSSFHEGNYIVIKVQDDGRGMDAGVLKQKALEKSLISEAEAKQMSDQEAFSLIFKPGFSTAKKVSNISGRGVGMDVVKTNIEKLNGIIKVQSEKGKGSTITLKIPLTLAIIQALLVKISGEFFAIPLVNVVETAKITSSDLGKVENRDVLNLRDHIIPIAYLGDALGIGKDKKVIDEEEIYVVVVAVAEKRIGFVVDSLIGREEIVIKSLGNYLTNIKAISGATIMGDGAVTLILDVGSVVRESSNISNKIEDHFIRYDKEADSVSCLIASNNDEIVRNISSIMRSKDYKVDVAKNNKDGMNAVFKKIYDVVFVDLSIPFTGGYEFVKKLREFSAYKKALVVGLSKDVLEDKEKSSEAKIDGVISCPVGEEKINQILMSVAHGEGRVA